MSTQTAENTPATSKDHVVCLVGMPNSGKTTLMNALTGGNFKTANYAGVTVSLLRGRSKPEFGTPRNIVDLPGVHSSVAPSPEEELAVEVIEGRHPKVKPDAFILVVDATQLERHLKFGGLVGRQGKPTVIALTMVGSVGPNRAVGECPEAFQRSGDSCHSRRSSNRSRREGAGCGPRWIERYALGGKHSGGTADGAGRRICTHVRRFLRRSGAVTRTAQPDSLTSRIDRFVLHRYLGFPVFFLVLISLFAAIFWMAQPFMDLIDAGFAIAADAVKASGSGFRVAAISGRRRHRRRWGSRGVLSADHDSVFPHDVA